MTTISTRPSASWPTPVRGLRGASWLEVNASWARKTGPPLRTSTGPPPTAFVTPVHSGRKISRTVRNVPTGDSSRSRWPAVPRATSTAPPCGIAVPPPEATWTTGPTRSVFGAVGGKGETTTSVTPGWAGVAGPYVRVKSEMPFVPGDWLRSFSVRRWPSPRQVPKNSIRRTSSAPSGVTPVLERSP